MYIRKILFFNITVKKNLQKQLNNVAAASSSKKPAQMIPLEDVKTMSKYIEQSSLYIHFIKKILNIYMISWYSRKLPKINILEKITKTAN